MWSSSRRMNPHNTTSAKNRLDHSLHPFCAVEDGSGHKQVYRIANCDFEKVAAQPKVTLQVPDDRFNGTAATKVYARFALGVLKGVGRGTFRQDYSCVGTEVFYISGKVKLWESPGTARGLLIDYY